MRALWRSRKKQSRSHDPSGSFLFYLILFFRLRLFYPHIKITLLCGLLNFYSPIFIYTFEFYITSMTLRNIIRIVRGTPAVDGAGVRLVRVIGARDVEDFDPFLMLDAFDSVNPEEYIKGFPFHPHRGIETVTYLIRGDIEHRDSLNNKGSIRDGECQWMTAGSGIIHQEMPQPTPHLFGAQLWVNLPKKHKMVLPKYRGLTADQIPLVHEAGQSVSVKVLSGDYHGTSGAMHGDYVDILYLDVQLKPDVFWELKTVPDNTLFIYILKGGAQFDREGDQTAGEKSAVLFDNADTFFVRAGPRGVRFLLMSGAPIKEPVAWGGPIVMNTRAELETAFRELEEGTFIKHP